MSDTDDGQLDHLFDDEEDSTDATADVPTDADGEPEPGPEADAASEPREVTHTVTIEMDGAVGVYDRQRHRNGDETVVLLTRLGDGYQALAVETDAGGGILATEEIGSATEDGRAASICEYWLEQNPKGILGGEPDDEGGLLSKLTGGGGA